MLNKRILKCILLLLTVFSLILGYSVTVCANEQTSYIVKVKDKKQLRLSQNDTYDNDDIKIFSDVYLTHDIEKFKQNHNIEICVPDYEMQLFGVNYPQSTSDSYIDEQWALDNINAQKAREMGLTGKNVKIGVIDSGVDFNHMDFKKTTFKDGHNCLIIPVIEKILDKNSYYDFFGHGTMVTGVISAHTDNELGIAGIADDATVMPIKITNDGGIKLSSILLAIQTAIDNKCDIINLSLGGTFENDPNAVNILKDVIKKADEAGIIIIAAVGNDGDSAINYPAGYDEVIGVTAINIKNEISSFSQKNDSVFISAPGEDVKTLSPDNKVITASGTSLAAPFVTAVAALVKEAVPNCSPSRFRQILKETAVDMGKDGYDNEYGYGKLDIGKVLDYIKEYIPDIIITSGINNFSKQIYIHNNSSENKTGNAYFISYNNKYSIYSKSDVPLNVGVTNIPFDTDSDLFCIWNKKMQPYTKKYIIK